ncbi:MULTISPECIES: MinD/ParA family ATP-binding protein [Nocardiaceae]|uniref:MinD/ParA family ATP-binding protein n=1 Tax=Nocardiaceae TaxID=85025 RepID=UPI00068DA4F0|nr:MULTISPECIES: hypothetical protein [Rhodococcus]
MTEERAEWMSEWLTPPPESPLPDTADQGARVLPLRAHPEPVPAPDPIPPMTLVLGACGGAGASTTALGLGNAWSARGHDVVVVDATPAGGDLVERGADSMVSDTVIETAFDSSDPDNVPASVADCTSATSAGAHILGRAWLQSVEPAYRGIDRYLRSQVDTSIYDLGHRGFGRAAADPLRSEPWAAIVLAVHARADAVNRMRAALETIRYTATDAGPLRTIVAISHQLPGTPGIDLDELRNHLHGRVFAVLDIPYDPHLATGLPITADELNPATSAAYEQLRASTVRAAAGGQGR